jgi:hypothetical protein
MKAGWLRSKPVEPGWYAVTICWDPEEGLFPDGAHWTGETWAGGLPVVLRSSATFPNEAAAKEWAYDNDMEDQ